MPGTQNSDATLRPTHPLALAPVIAPPASVDGFVKQFLANLNFDQGVSLSASDANDQYLALAGTVRDYLMARWLEDQTRQREHQAKTVCYLSAEYLLGKQLDNNLLAARLGEIKVPTLVMWGTADSVFPVAGAESLAAAIPDAELLLLEGAPHPAYLDQPDLFHERLLEFVRLTRS